MGKVFENKSMKSISQRGGSRAGAGRPRGARNKIARTLKNLLAPADEKAVKRLMDIIDHGPAKEALEAIRLSFEYRHGKPRQIYEHPGDQEAPVDQNVIVIGGSERNYIQGLREARGETI